MSAKKRRKIVIDSTLTMNERIYVRLTHWQARELREVCKANHCAPSTLVRGLINRFLLKYEEQGRPIPPNPGDQ